MEQWPQKWLLTFHPKKCHVLTLENFYNITDTEKYTFHRQELEHVFEQKNLGLILDAELKYDEHISVKVKKVNAIAGLICRTFSYLGGPLFKKLFTTLVKPHLEYRQVIWTPHLKKYITILENVQTLIYRRARGNMIDIFKHFNYYDNCTLAENLRP